MADYCSTADMLRFGAAELSQRSVNINDEMVSPDVLESYIESGTLPADQAEADLLVKQISVIDAAIEEASREIDFYLSMIATTPLQSAVPHIIRDAACRIARYRLARYEEGTESESRVYRDYKLTIAMLKDVADGKRNIPGLADDALENAESIYYSVKAPEAIY